MTRIDQFESVFRAAAKSRYTPGEVKLDRIMVVTDLDADAGRRYTARIATFLEGVTGIDSAAWTALHGETETVGALLEAVQNHEPDLVCTYRNLHSGSFRWPYTLGDHAAVLTQVTRAPVLLLPRPEDMTDEAVNNTDRVMAITDHLAGDARLVDHAVAFTRTGGRLTLAHVEDDGVFERYLDVVGKIPEIDTDTARELIRARLLKEPADYVETIRQALAEGGLGAGIQVASEITMGHQLSVYRALVERQRIDLLVLNTKDDDQLAMHGLAYPLAVELRRVPMLML